MTPIAGTATPAVRPSGETAIEQRLQAWLVEYTDKAPSGANALAVIKEPRAAWALSRSVDPMSALAGEVKPPANSDDFVFIFVPSGSATAYDVQKQAEQWMASRPGEQDGIMEVSFRSERLLWRRGRALCFGTPQFVGDMLAAVTHFSLSEGDLGRLERQAEDACATMAQDKHLCDNLRAGDLKYRPHIDAMTRAAVDMRLAYLRIDKALEAQSTEISGSARRIFVELTVLATAKYRVDRLDDVVDAILEQYKFINDRFSDYRYHLREYYLVAIIVLLIFLQFISDSRGFVRPQLERLLGVEQSSPPPTTNP
jgi:hypothetical protein